MNILGLNAYHADASAALLRDGELIAVAEEERFTRVKHWAGLPVQAVAWCLKEAKISFSHIDVAAVNRDARANRWRKLGYAVRRRPQLRLIRDRLTNLGRVRSLIDELERVLGAEFRGEFREVEHHVAHQASAFLVSPFEEAALLSVDGFGDFASASWGFGRRTDVEIGGKVYFPHSLGTFYLTMTQYLGFPKYGDEYKVMGLAPYGVPRFLPQMRDVVRTRRDGTFALHLRYFRHHREDLRYKWNGGAPTVEPHYSSALEALLGPARRPDEPIRQVHHDIARSVQARFEEAVFALLRMLHDLHPVPAVVLSGGAAMNSVANGKITRETPFDRVFVPPAPGDAGGAVGAALAVWHRESGAPRNGAMIHSYYGQRYDADRCRQTLGRKAGRLERAGCAVEFVGDEEGLCVTVAREVAAGKVVGWFQGGMEFGPRALGNRSILCDPRRSDMRNIINAKIKLREPFRPFAPSVLRDRMAEWFVVDDDVPFMMKVFEIRPEMRERIPAVTHVDGTGRPHTVTRESNPLYYRLIERFSELTGVPLVLNTSFNENEPIVHRPEEAVDCFLRTDMDVLALGPFVVRKSGAAESVAQELEPLEAPAS